MCLSTEIPSTLPSGSSTSILSSSVRTNNKFLHFYSVDGYNSNSFEKKGNISVSLPRQLVRKELESSNPSKGQTVHSSIDVVPGTHNQSREIGINPFANICFYRDGIPHNGKHCQNSSRQN